MHKHRPGDGCVGAHRTLEEDDLQDITEAVGRIMRAVAGGDVDAAIEAGRFVGIHYGVGGEALLGIDLARQIAFLATSDMVADDNTISLPRVVSHGDPQVVEFTEALMSRLVTPPDPPLTDDEQQAVLLGCLPVLGEFVNAVRDDEKQRAWDAWIQLYGMEVSQTSVLRGAYVSAYLAVAASRVSVQRVPV